jgi:hypothetical protein
MLALSDDLQREIARPYAEPVYFWEIELLSRTPGQPSLTLRLSDRYIPHQLVGVPTTGVLHEALALVQDFGAVEIALNATDAGGAPTTAEPVFFNTTPIAGYARLGDIDADYEFAGARATLYRVGLDTPLAVLFIEEPADVGDTLLRLRMSDITLALEGKLSFTRIDREEFPRCSQAVVGRIVPRAVGRLVAVPATPVVDGAVGVLSGALSAGATSVPLVDATDFPDAGTAQIGTEHLSWTEKSGAVLTGVTRGVNGTEADTHTDQDAVLVVLSGPNAYRFVVAEHDTFRTAAISNIKVDGLPARTSPSIDIDAGDLVAGKRFAVIGFTPTSVKDFHVLPTSAIQVAQANPPGPVTFSVGVVPPANYFVGTASLPSVTGAELGKPRVLRTLDFKITVSGGGFSTNIILLRGGVFGVGTVIYDKPAVSLDTGSVTYDTGGSVENEAIYVYFGTVGAAAVTPEVTKYEASITAGSGRSPRSTASLVIGDVTCDVVGVQDDSDGTVTGIPQTLIEIPGHVMRFLATAVYGVPVAELGPRWAAAIVQHVNAGLRWAFLLGADGPPKFSDVRTLAGEQSNSRVTVDHGLLDMVWRPDAPAADMTLDYERDIWADAPATLAKINPTQRFNRVVGSAQLDYAGAAGYRYTVIREDLSQPGFDQPVEMTLELPWVQDAATADFLVEAKLREAKAQPRELALVGYQGLLGLQTMDHVRLINHPGLAAHGGDATLFRVLGKSYQLADNPARIGLTAIEANP